MSLVTNPFVSYLARYTTASPDHEAAFDEFLAQTLPPSGSPLRLATRVEAFLKTCFVRADPPSVILTGNAGDGKTYLCRQILAAFGGPVPDWDTLADLPVERDGLRLHVVKDLSELGDARGVEVLQGLAAAWGNSSQERYLIAANEGRLRDLLNKAGDAALYEEVDRQLKQGADAGSQRLVVINLTAVTTSSFVPEALRWMTDAEHWAACQTCPIRERCPVRHNAARLSEPHVAKRVQLLYQLLEHLDIHVTVRDMLIHLAYTLTGDRRCAELHRLDAAGRDRSGLAYYLNVWGGDEQSPFRRKASVVQHLSRLRIGDHSLFEIDDFVVNSAEDDEHKRVFAPAVDLDFRRFAQDRAAYIEGGAERLAGEEARALLRWLPHCRRKLFFEWREEIRANQLIAFHFLDDYLQLLEDERGRTDEVRRSLVLGLNRAFSRLYLTDADNLYVTSQYLHSTEQSRPLVRLTIPVSGITLRVDRRAEHAFDRAWPDLYLVIGAPPALLLHDPGAASRQQQWPLNLLLFEYLMRLAHGGTYNILAEECELSVRSLKDRLLSVFGHEPAGGDIIEFFVAERRQYTLKKLHIDDQGTIRSGG
jgi:hypothetical protein